MKKFRNIFLVMTVVTAMTAVMAGCAQKPVETTAAATEAATEAETEAVVVETEPKQFLGDAGYEEDGEYTALAEGESGWEEDRKAVAKTYEVSGKKAPGDMFVRAKAESVIRLVNEERSKSGIGGLTLDEPMMAAAETRAQEQKQAFSHTRPDGSSCFTVFAQYGIPSSARGENVGCGGVCTPEQITNAWMNSPGHRENIMNGVFTRIGVGCFESGGYSYWAQVFAN